MTAMRTLVTALRAPASVAPLSGAQWSALLSVARAEALLGTLAWQVRDVAKPPRVAALLDAAYAAACQAQRHALWEAELARRTLAPVGIAPVLLKGTAYVALGLDCAAGRQIGDLDILLPEDRLDAAEAALLAAGWVWLKTDPYDQRYYREWMHELPPLAHSERGTMIDVHHRILPRTHRARPDAAAMIARAVGVGGGADGRALLALDPVDRLIHAAAHALADGDLTGGLRNLWDIHGLAADLDPAGWTALDARAREWGLATAVHRALRLAHRLYGTNLPDGWAKGAAGERLFLRRLMARDDWGRERRPSTRLGFTIREHAMRMPPALLARHLWTKARRD